MQHETTMACKCQPAHKRTVSGELEFRDISLLLRRDQRLVWRWNGALDALGKAEPDFLIDGARNEGLLRIIVREIHVIYPLRPLPCEAEVAQVVREPIDEATRKFQVEAVDVAVEIPDRTPEAGRDGSGRKLAGLDENRVEVDELVFGGR